MKNLLLRLLLISVYLFVVPTYADNDLISLFPLDNYNQTISAWIKPTDSDYNKLLLDADTQKKHQALFYEHYFGAFSPWNVVYVNSLLMQAPPYDLKTIEQGIVADFCNQNKPADEIGYAENFRPHTDGWIKNIAANINISQFSNVSYRAEQRGIAIANLSARALPAEDVHFYSYKLAGEGYPFDNLQMSALWVGTPVYIIGETRDQAWSLVITPDYIAWVKSNGIARANDVFINQWTNAAKNKLAAITRTQASVIDGKGRFLFSAYIGSVFPALRTFSGLKLAVPVANENQEAVIKTAVVSSENATLIPVTVTPHHIARIMSSLIGRPYGWGGMYFYNDCSAELKSVFTPFGIWLPRHSSDQVTIGKMVDMTSAPPEQRLSYLMENGHKFMSIVYIGGHVILYVGNYPNGNNPSLMAMTYQNVWGLSPNPPARRAVIGQSVLFPLLLQYPEDTSLMSLAAKKYFQVSYLDQLPSNIKLLQSKRMNLKSLMYPDNKE